MNRRRARHMSRRARAAEPAKLPPVPRNGCAHAAGFKLKHGNCGDCGAIHPYWLLGPALQHLVNSALNLELRRIPELDEAPPERETFSGGVYVGARERNLQRLSYTIVPAARLIVVGKYTLAFLREHAKVRTSGEANERIDVRARMQALGLSTEGLR